jgi:sialate O-acetylesterase
MKKNLDCWTAGIALATAFSASAALAAELPGIFASHMVMQRGVNAPVWGKAAPGATVSVEFSGQKKAVVAGEDGKWMIRLEPMGANAEPQTMTITDPSGSVIFDDVLVGDNWICSGQSNMEFDLNNTVNSQQELEDVVNHPTIRFYRLEGHITVDTPQENCPGTWHVLTPDAARPLTAVGYFFGRKINTETHIPVGLVHTSWAGTAIEPWINPAGFHGVPELADYARRIDSFDVSTELGQKTQKDLVQKVSEWLIEAKPAAEANRLMPPVPAMPPRDNSCGIYNGMIAPLVPFGIKGAIWYQGESNGSEGISYFHKMQALIGGWRQDFGLGDFPFYFVQLANFTNPNPNPEGGDGWAKVREAQRKALEIPNTGMAVAIDLADADNPGDIHPKNKQDVGDRLAQWALYQTYGQKDVVPSGPIFKSLAAADGKLTLSFDWLGSGLMVGKKEGLKPTHEIVDGKLKGFAVAGEDRKWAWANAVIDGRNVVLSSPEVQKPVAVRYAYSMNPEEANLYNKEGLPASPFRSDDW